MNVEATNVEILRNAYKLWSESSAASVDHWMDLMSDRVNWRSLADGAPGMEFTRSGGSKEEVRSYFHQLAQDWELQSYTVDEFIAQGHRVVALGRCVWKHRWTGKIVDTPKADVLRLQDGKITDFMEYYDTAGALAATM